VLAALLTGLIAGLLNSPHCLGMCGGFPLHLSTSTSGRIALIRQLLFVAGKTFTYVFLGSIAGALGVIVFKNGPLSPFAPILRILLGIFMLLIGLSMLGVNLLGNRLSYPSSAGVFAEIFHRLIREPSYTSAFILGIAAGFLPCPLPMGLLSLAALSNNTINGMLSMAGLGLGTAPVLLAAGLLGSSINKRFAVLGMRAAGLVVMMLGIAILGKASGFWTTHQCCCGEMSH